MKYTTLLTFGGTSRALFCVTHDFRIKTLATGGAAAAAAEEEEVEEEEQQQEQEEEEEKEEWKEDEEQRFDYQKSAT